MSTPAPLDDDIPCRGQYSELARRTRLDWWRRTAGAGLDALREPGIDARSLRGNIENYVATVEIPVGLAGPLLFTGEHARGGILAPLATTEGALVASVTRGAKAMTRSGGVTTRVLSQRMVRAPAFEFASLDAAAAFAAWIGALDRRARLAAQVRAVSRYSTLLDVDPIQLGRVVHVRFVFETGDAAGQNMTTVSTWRACQWIRDELAATGRPAPVWFTVEGNMSGDKKLTALNRFGGRGSHVQAECLIDHETLRRVLKTDARSIASVWRKAQLAAQFSGAAAADIDATNVIAAMFVATGQDVACVHESGAALFSAEETADGLLAGLILPNLIVGTVGGGTTLAQQHDFLAAMGCTGEHGARRLAEIVCGYALALDLSTAAAIVAGQFADAHARLGRSTRVDWLTAEAIDATLVASMMADALARPELTVSEVTALDHGGVDSLLTEAVGGGERRKFVGLLPLSVSYALSDQDTKTAELIAKVKPVDEEVIIELGKLASLAGGEVAEQHARWREHTGFRDTHTRELALYRHADGALRAVMPELYGLLEDQAREAYVLLLERLGSDVILRDTVDAPADWQPEHLAAALDGIAGVHAQWLGREAELAATGRLGAVRTPEQAADTVPLWRALVAHNAAEFPRWIGEADRARLAHIVETSPVWWTAVAAAPRTLVHGDFNLRNIALRAGDHRLVAYDWELATIHLPQRDLADFLAFALPPDVGPDRVAELVEHHRAAIEHHTGAPLDPAAWRRGYRWALWDFAIYRLQLLLLAHAHQELPFLERVTATTLRLLALEMETV
ncbi:phosphotransferase [Nocardia sp. NPDC005978]|uniref:phosphotransferase n=1 Tax=Nocardia sp. NPDC005978 TaxID=3156725 RepID=UPI00339F3ADE